MSVAHRMERSMKVSVALLCCALPAFAASAALAQDGGALVTSKGCMTCHAVDQKKVGPSFKDIAAKYAGNSAAQATIVAELRDGKGHMRIAATEPEITAMTGYILAIK
jgi:cytochrome c